MSQRIIVLTSYFLRTLFFSLAGIIYIILTLVYWAIFFPPGQGTPDMGNYILVIGAFGAVVAFLSTLTIAARANRAENYPLIVRLPSRVEYVTAVLLSALSFTLILQIALSLLALINGPGLSSRMLDIPPLWISINILAIVLSLHASDLVTSGWSRVIVYGVIAVLLIGQTIYTSAMDWLANFIISLSSAFYNIQSAQLAELASRFGAWLRDGGTEGMGKLLNAVFWPFHAILDGVMSSFTPTQALAPAILLLYASILFLLAADLFATKDLELTE